MSRHGGDAGELLKRSFVVMNQRAEFISLGMELVGQGSSNMEAKRQAWFR